MRKTEPPKNLYEANCRGMENDQKEAFIRKFLNSFTMSELILLMNYFEGVVDKLLLEEQSK